MFAPPNRNGLPATYRRIPFRTTNECANVGGAAWAAAGTAATAARRSDVARRRTRIGRVVPALAEEEHEMRAEQLCRAHAVERRHDANVEVSREPSAFRGEAGAVHDERVRRRRGGVPDAPDQVAAGADLFRSRGGRAGPGSAVEHDHGRLTPRERGRLLQAWVARAEARSRRRCGLCLEVPCERVPEQG